MISEQIISPDYSKKRNENYGGSNSDFALVTYDNNNKISLFGVLSELPSFSYSPRYEDGPGTTITEKLNQFMCNDIMSIANAIGPADNSFNFKNLVASDSMTKRMYAGIEYGGIDLKFKIYENFLNGNSLPADWITQLSNFATISHNNNTTADNYTANIGAAAKNFEEVGSSVVNVVTLNKSELLNDKSKIKQEQYDKLRAAKENFDSKLAELNAIVNGWGFNKSFILKEYDSSSHIYFGLVVDANYCTSSGNIGNHIYNISSSGLGITRYMPPQDDCILFSIKKDWQTSDEEPDKLFKNNLKDFFNSASNNCIINYIRKNDENVYKETLSKEPTKNRTSSDSFGSIIDSIRSEFTDNATIRDYLLNTEVIGTINALGDSAVTRYGMNRVPGNFNQSNALGSKLWHLYIFTWLFKYPLPVFIKNWRYKKSNENGVSYDFTISCEFDQVYSKDTWKTYFGYGSI